MKWSTFIVLALVFIFLEHSKCSKILMVFPMVAPSHYILGSSLAKGLAEAGHNITVVSPFVDRNPQKNVSYRDVVLTGFLEERKNLSFNMFSMENMNPFVGIFTVSMLGYENTRKTFEHPNFQKLLNSGEEFDAVIVERFVNDALHGVASHFNAPLIVLSTIGASSWINDLVGNPSPPSYIPEPLMNYPSDMSFLQRLRNWIFLITYHLYNHLYFLPLQNKLMKTHLPHVPDLSIINYNASIVLVNSHESMSPAVPHVPNMIDIGGYHIGDPQTLPWDVQKFMEDAEDGVVYFSMGSNIKPTDMPDDKRDIILKVLGKLKQRVLWKWNDNDIPNKPPNVKLFKWLPQQDILAHRKTKLFITHGGLLSTIETVYHGVPILAFPIFGDQMTNGAQAERAGYGISLPFSEITEEKLTETLNQLLAKKSKYRKNAKRRSKLMHDRPVQPMDLAKYWVDFVIRHKGAPHLRVAGVDLPWYKYLLIDVILFVILVTFGVTAALGLIVRRLCCRRKKNEAKAKPEVKKGKAKVKKN